MLTKLVFEMRNEPLPGVINLETLVPKLTFLERNADEISALTEASENPVGSERLRTAIVAYRSGRRPESNVVPTIERVNAWLAGSATSAAEVEFLADFFQNRYYKKYSGLQPQQKKVFNQIRRFFRQDRKDLELFSSQNTGKSDTGSVSAGRQKVRLVDVQIVLDGLVDHLDDARTRVEQERPNSPDSIQVREKSLELIEFIDEKIDAARIDIQKAISDSEAEVSESQVAIFEEIGEEFRKWLTENNPEIVDAVMRLTPAASFIGLMSLAGANMVWATPVVLALCGGKRIVELLKSIKP